MPNRSTEHAIATWPSTATSVGVRTDEDSLDVCAPYGLSDLFGLVVRPNTTLVSREVYEEKAALAPTLAAADRCGVARALTRPWLSANRDPR